MKPEQLRELAQLASLAADWLDDPNHPWKESDTETYWRDGIWWFDCVLCGKYGIHVFPCQNTSNA